MTTPRPEERARIWDAAIDERPRLLAVARFVLIDKSLVEDAVQEGIERAVRQVGTRPLACRGDAADELARQVRWRSGEMNRDLLRARRTVDAIARCAPLARDIGDGIDAIALRSALAGLDPEERATIALRSAGVSWADVAARTGASPRQAIRRGARGVRSLRRALADDLPRNPPSARVV